MLHKLTLLAGLTSLAASIPTPPFFGENLVGTSFGTPGLAAEYDYIIVGGGCAGLTVATRLAENNSVSVAVIEAGTFYELSNGNLSEIPAMDVNYMGKDPHDWQPGIDWGFVTAPQKGALNQSVHYARGKTLGGSTARNIMTYHAGTRGAYHQWAQVVNDTSYEYDNLWPYFMKHQNHTAPDYNKRFPNTTVDYNASRLGTEGPVQVIYPNFASALGTYVELGLNESGMRPIDGFESGRLLGSGYALASINFDKNTRDSAETAYLEPALVNENNLLTIYPSTMAKRVMFDNNMKATGVIVDTEGLTWNLTAKREVILSAGSFQSPQLLMVSGIGPQRKLQPHGIHQRVNLTGVGENMWDHILFGPSFRVNVQTTGASQNPAVAAQAVIDFNEHGSGPLTNPGVDVFGWEKIPTALTRNFSAQARADIEAFPSDWPDFEWIFPGAVFGYSRDFVRDQPQDGHSYGSIIAALLTPMSRGTIDIQSADTADHPIIDPQWLQHPTDQAMAIAAFKRARQIWASPSLTEITIGKEYFPGLNVTSDADILHLIRQALTPVSHAACTNKMGLRSDPSAVVDNQCRVFGAQGLRVVDASALPFLPPGHPMATLYALAEKIADDIKATW